MADQNGTTTINDPAVEVPSDTKGKGKATATEVESHDVSMDGEDSSSEEELDEAAPIADEEDPDTMEEIDLDNIVGSRTRGRKIDFAKAAEQLPEEDDDEDEDDDFEAPEDEDKMEE